MKDQEITLDQMFAYVTENLPEGYELKLSMVRGEISMEAEDENYSYVNRVQDDMTFGDKIQDYVNFARATRGLPGVPFVGASQEQGGVC